MTAHRSPLTRVWRMSFAIHAVALLAVLVALAVFVGTGSSFSEDEGAAIVQARQLADHNTWIVPHPAAGAFPDGAFYPYKLSETGAKGRAPFARHPVYGALLAGLWRLGGINALVALSMVGTVSAALGAARLARLWDAALARPAFWLAGLGSPLLFDGFLVMAHTIGAALAAWLLVRVLRREDQSSRLAALGGFALAAALVLVRTEGTFFVLALAVVLAASRRVILAGATILGASSALAFDRLWVRAIVGAPVPHLAANSQSGGRFGISGRVDGAVTILFRFSYDEGARSNVLLLFAFALTALAALAASRRMRGAAVTAATAAAAAVLARVLVGRADAVPGLLVVCPVLWAGVWMAAFSLREGHRRDQSAVVLGFAACVLATQYAQGGGIEWGGRYLALALPAALASSVYAFRSAPRSLVAALAVASLAFSALGVTALRRTHQRTEVLLDAIPRQRGEFVLTTAGLLPRLDWPDFEDRQWLWVDPEHVDAVVARLRSNGARHIAVVFPDALAPKGWESRGAEVPGLPWRVVRVPSRL